MTMVALAGMAFSAALLVLLCLGDPKRRRTLRLSGTGHTPAARRLIVVAACLPGLLCVALGDAAAFLIWLGGSGVAGWIATAWIAQRTPG